MKYLLPLSSEEQARHMLGLANPFSAAAQQDARIAALVREFNPAAAGGGQQMPGVQNVRSAVEYIERQGVALSAGANDGPRGIGFIS